MQATPAPDASPSPEATPSAEPSPALVITNETPSAAPATASRKGASSRASGDSKPAAQPKEPALDQGVIVVKADEQGHSKDHSWFKGNALLRFGEVAIFADAIDLFTTALADGKEQRRLVAEGNVVFVQEDERLSGTKLDMDLSNGKGTFENPYGYVSPGLFVSGKTLQRLDPRTYVVDDPTFTSCAQPNPRWAFTASTAKIRVGDKLIAKNALFRVKSAPTPLFFPYFMYPIGHDGRGTGLLFPRFGFGANKGFETGLGFFWAMGRSFDQTFSFDNYTKFGYGFGDEFRYALGPRSNGTFNAYFFKQTQTFQGRPPVPGRLEYDIDVQAKQALPFKFFLSGQSREYSSLGFQQRSQDSVYFSTQRNKATTIALTRQVLGGANFSIVGDRQETFYSDTESVIRGHRPSARLRQLGRKLGRTGLQLSYDFRAENLESGDNARVDSYNRYDASQEISRPTNFGFLQFTPRFKTRETRYGSTLLTKTVPVSETASEDRLVPVGPALDRRYYEASGEFRGPTFSRVFGGIGGYSDKIKHVIGPELVFTYRSKIDAEDFNRIPKFDGEDYALGTKQVSYALVQSLFAKRPSGDSGKTAPYEFFTLRVAQTYFGDVRLGQRNVDNNSESADYDTKKPTTTIHTSPIQTRLRFRPVPAFSTNLNFEYDPRAKSLDPPGPGLKSASLSAGLSLSRGSLDLAYSKSNFRRLSQNPNAPKRDLRSGSARGHLEIVPKRVTLQGRVDYDFEQKRLFNTMAELKYSAQCCGIGIQAYKKSIFDIGGSQGWGYKFQIELANIGSVGSNSDRGGALSGRR